MHRVLITGIGGNIGQGVLKALRAGKRDYFIVGIDMEPLSAGFSLADKYYKVSKTSSHGFKNEFRDIVKKEKIEAVYVCSPTELDFFSMNKDALTRELGVTIFVNPPDVVRIGSDKLLTAGFLKDTGFPYPETVLAEDKKGVDSLIKKYGFPLLIKPRKGFTSTNVFIVNSKKEIDTLRALIPDIIVQKYIPDAYSEYTAATLSGPDKKVRASIILHRHIYCGTTYRTELMQDDKLTSQVVKIAEKLGAVGTCNFQFRIVKGKVFVFEINPRLSGTCGIRYLYGFNDSEMLFELFRLNIDVSQPKLTPAVVFRYWNEIFIPGADFKDLRKGRKPHTGRQNIIDKRKPAKGAIKNRCV